MTLFEKGRAYRRVTHNGEERVLVASGTKLYWYDEFGIVFVGPGYNYTMPNGQRAEGYTDDPFFVQQYEEMWAEEEAGTASDPALGLIR